MRLSIFQSGKEEEKCDGLFLPAWHGRKINLMVLPGGGILENVLIMQIAFVVLIAVLLIVCALEITAYYHRILVPLEKFGQKLEDLEKSRV